MDRKILIEDDIYENLREYFLHSGTGQPPALKKSDLQINNRLLVQLSYLREEGSKPQIVFDDWLKHIDPALCDIPLRETALIRLVINTKKRFLSLDESELEGFLAIKHDLDFISESLSALGVTKKSYINPPETYPISADVTNEVVLDLFRHSIASKALPKKLLYEWLHRLTGFELGRLKHRVDKVIKSYRSRAKSKNKNPETQTQLEQFLKSKFTLPPVSHKIKMPHSPVPASQLPPVSHKIKMPHSPVPASQFVLPCKRQVCIRCRKKNKEKKDLLNVIRNLHSEKAELQKKLNASEKKARKFQETLKRAKSDWSAKRNKEKRESHEKFKEKLKVKTETIESFEGELSGKRGECVLLEWELTECQKQMNDLVKENESLRRDSVSCTCRQNVISSQSSHMECVLGKVKQEYL